MSQLVTPLMYLTPATRNEPIEGIGDGLRPHLICADPSACHQRRLKHTLPWNASKTLKSRSLLEGDAHLALQGLLRDCIPNDRLRSAPVPLVGAIQIDRDDLRMCLPTSSHFHCRLCVTLVCQPDLYQDLVCLLEALGTRPTCQS